VFQRRLSLAFPKTKLEALIVYCICGVWVYFVVKEMIIVRFIQAI